MPYEVHLDVFDGPFSLLLQLIAQQEVEIYEVRLADVVDAFVAEMLRAETLDLEVSTEFLLIAATLVELKCRRLLPGGTGSDLGDDVALYEARDYLLARLVECRTFASAAAALSSAEELAARSVPRRAGPDERFVDLAPDLLRGVTPERIAEVARRALTTPRGEAIGEEHVLVDEVSVGARLRELCEDLPGAGETTFRYLTEQAPSRAHVVATFLALLELYKRALVDLGQTETFGTLVVRWIGGESPVEGLVDLDDYGIELGGRG